MMHMDPNMMQMQIDTSQMTEEQLQHLQMLQQQQQMMAAQIDVSQMSPEQQQ